MRFGKLTYSILLLNILGLVLAGCQTHDVNDAKSDIVPKKEWATFPAPDQKSYTKKFPSTFRVVTINGDKLTSSRNDGRVDCLRRPCKLHPGQHEIGLKYVWSQTESKKKQKAKKFGNALLAPFVFYGGGGAGPS